MQTFDGNARVIERHDIIDFKELLRQALPPIESKQREQLRHQARPYHRLLDRSGVLKQDRVLPLVFKKQAVLLLRIGEQETHRFKKAEAKERLPRSFGKEAFRPGLSDRHRRDQDRLDLVVPVGHREIFDQIHFMHDVVAVGRDGHEELFRRGRIGRDGVAHPAKVQGRFLRRDGDPDPTAGRSDIEGKALGLKVWTFTLLRRFEIYAC